MTTTVRHIRDGTYDPLNPDHVYIGRANRSRKLPESKWANPFPIEGEPAYLREVVRRQSVIAKYDAYLAEAPDLMAALPELKGKTLYCWCKPKACHGDVLAELASGTGATVPPSAATADGPPLATSERDAQSAHGTDVYGLVADAGYVPPKDSKKEESE